MQRFFKSIFKGDPVIWAFIFLAMAFSIVLIFSATSNFAFESERTTGNFYGPIMAHVSHVLVALVVCLFGARVHPKYFGKFVYIGLIIAFVLLLVTTLAGVDINNAKRWVSIFGVQFQPSEIVKLAVINYTAFQLGSSYYNSRRTFWMIFVPSIAAIGLIFWNNISTSMLLAMVVFLMCLTGGANRKMVSIVAITAVVSVVLGIIILMAIPKDMAHKIGGRISTGKDRIEKFKEGRDSRVGDPNKTALENYIASLDLSDEDTQVGYSHIAIARGGLFGVGAGNSETRYMLPQPFSDFIYAIIAEEYGLVGCSLVVIAYLILFFRIALIARKTHSMYLKLLLMGIGYAIIIQAFLNMAVASGLFPVTGQPLPFLSRGGTSYLITSLYFAVLLSVTHHIRKEREKREAEILEAGGNTVVEVEAFPAVPEVDTEVYGEDGATPTWVESQSI